MKKLVLLGLIGLIFMLSSGMMAKMSDGAAKSKAMTIWGSHSATAKFWSTGQSGVWTYQVGCWDPTHSFLVTGQGSSWEDAFAHVNMQRNGPYLLSATATQANGMRATSPRVMLYACNIQLPQQ